MRRRALATLLFLSTVAAGAINDDMRTRISDGISLSPVLGYDPTYGILVGGAFFRGDTTPRINNLEVFLYATFDTAFGVETKYTLWSRENHFFRIEFLASSFYDAYFGEGNQTDPDVKTEIDLVKVQVDPSYWIRLDRRLSVGLVSYFRYRHETGLNGVSGQKIFGTDFTPMVGVALQYDGRDHQILTTSGTYFQAQLDGSHEALSTRTGAETFGRLDIDSRFFHPATRSLVLAAQFAAGTTLGDPGFQYRYALGGSRRLRGYQANRLRGRHYYMAQGEARWTLVRWLGLVGFAGIGDAADRNYSDFRTPRWTAGAGLRLGLPPDFVARARLDFAISGDEFAFYLNFNEAF